MRSRDDLFEWHVLRHLDAATNLAWWFLQNRQDAEDVVQEAMVRAYRSFGDLKGSDAKPWLMQIVRNGCLRHLEKKKRIQIVPLDETIDPNESFRAAADAEAEALRFADADRIQAALRALPELYREVLVLREFEGMNYSEIAQVAGVPIGTVMSRLSRARSMLARNVRDEVEVAS